MSNKIIEYLLKSRPNSDWIVNQSRLPYLKLSIDIPVELILTEWEYVKDKSVLHRAGDNYATVQNEGWKSLVLYGAHSTATTNEVKEEFLWTEIAAHCPKTTQWLKDTFIINQNTGRIRFMLLEPNGHIVLHKDREQHGLNEINIAITHPDDCIFRFKNYGNVPFKAGTAFLMDVSNEHFVVNNSEIPRLHMIVHSAIDDKIIENSYANCFYS